MFTLHPRHLDLHHDYFIVSFSYDPTRLSRSAFERIANRFEDLDKTAAAPSLVSVDPIDDQTLEQYIKMEMESADECDQREREVHVPQAVSTAAEAFREMLEGILNYWLGRPGHYPPPGNSKSTSDYQHNMSKGFEALLDDQMESAAHYAFMEMQGAGVGFWDQWEHLYPQQMLEDLNATLFKNPAMRNAFNHLESTIRDAAYDQCGGEDDGEGGDDDDGSGGETLRRSIDRPIGAPESTPRMQASFSKRRRVASISEIPSEFRHLGAGIYKNAHALWELRAAEDSAGGYVLVRRSEERAVDMRDDINAASPMSSIKAGTKVAALRQGQQAPAVVVYVAPQNDGGSGIGNPAMDMAMLDFGNGALEQRPISELTVAESVGHMPTLDPHVMSAPPLGSSLARTPGLGVDGDVSRDPINTVETTSATTLIRLPSEGFDPVIQPSSKASTPPPAAETPESALTDTPIDTAVETQAKSPSKPEQQSITRVQLPQLPTKEPSEAATQTGISAADTADDDKARRDGSEGKGMSSAKPTSSPKSTSSSQSSAQKSQPQSSMRGDSKTEKTETEKTEKTESASDDRETEPKSDKFTAKAVIRRLAQEDAFLIIQRGGTFNGQPVAKGSAFKIVREAKDPRFPNGAFKLQDIDNGSVVWIDGGQIGRDFKVTHSRHEVQEARESRERGHLLEEPMIDPSVHQRSQEHKNRNQSRPQSPIRMDEGTEPTYVRPRSPQQAPSMEYARDVEEGASRRDQTRTDRPKKQMAGKAPSRPRSATVSTIFDRIALVLADEVTHAGPFDTDDLSVVEFDAFEDYTAA